MSQLRICHRRFADLPNPELKEAKVVGCDHDLGCEDLALAIGFSDHSPGKWSRIDVLWVLTLDNRRFRVEAFRTGILQTNNWRALSNKDANLNKNNSKQFI